MAFFERFSFKTCNNIKNIENFKGLCLFLVEKPTFIRRLITLRKCFYLRKCSKDGKKPEKHKNEVIHKCYFAAD